MEGVSTVRVVKIRPVTVMSIVFRMLYVLTNCILLVSAQVVTHQWGGNKGSISTTADVLKITDFCPGVQYLINQENANNISLQVNVSDCENNEIEPTAHQGVIYGVCEDLSSFCKMHIKTHRGEYVQVFLQRLAYWCDLRHWVISISYSFSRYRIQCGVHSLEEMFFESKSHMLIKSINRPLTNVLVKTMKISKFIFKRTENYSGYLITPCFFTEEMIYPNSVEWKVSSRHLMMVSIKQSHDVFGPCLRSDSMPDLTHIKMISLQPNQTKYDLNQLCRCPTGTVHVIHASYLTFVLPNGNGNIIFSFLTIYISTIPITTQNIKMPNGLINCSVHDYSYFQKHVDCNLNTDCEDGRDETEHCAFSSPHCQGLVASRHKCFQQIFLNSSIELDYLSFECQKRKGRLASVKTRKEQTDFLHLFQDQFQFSVTVGIMSGWRSVPFLYRKVRRWSDKTLIYNLNHFISEFAYTPGWQFLISGITSMMVLDPISYCDIVCEVKLQEESVFLPHVSLASLQSPPPVHTHQSFFVCQDWHVTHMFLACDSICTKATGLKSCHYINASSDTAVVFEEKKYQYSGVFTCEDDVSTVYYIFLCDFIHDCPDGSDESFCEHPSYAEDFCSDSQCVLSSQRCNQFSDLLDNSDEVGCDDSAVHPIQFQHEYRKKRFYLNLDGTGYFTQQVMSAEQSCPGSHYQCKVESMYCLPVYTRCNGFSDCVYGEDEQGCNTAVCPGFYQCRSSTVCVHGDHLCDGWGQCPKRDDELMCDFTCSEGCLCHGYAFRCYAQFSSDLYPKLRYLDASDSNMSLADFDRNIYLVYLKLSRCFLYNISHSKLLNLKHLDLAANMIKSINVTVLLVFLHLKTLRLEKNPLSSLESEMICHIHYALRQLLVSRISLNILYKSISLYLPKGEVLNVSFCAIDTIGQIGLKTMPHLKQLDISGNPITSFPFDLLSRLDQIEHIESSNFRLCCKNLLPRQANPIKCFSPRVVLTSCTMLISTELYKVFLWVITSLSITGNFLCFLVSSAVITLFRKRFVQFISQLQFASICMGIHLSIVVLANHILHGNYIHSEKAWTKNVICKLAGFLFFLAGVMSVLIIWFITMHHVTIFCFPGQSWRFSRCLTATACVVMWVIGFLMATVPFLPGLSHWGLQGQSGLCRLALFDSDLSGQHFRWFTVAETVNCICCVMMVAGQAVIYRQTPKYRITLNPIQRSVCPAVHVVRKLAVTEAACWIALALAALIRSHGVAIFDLVHDTMVVFVLPLNSALHPLLYMWTARSQWQHQQLEDKMVQVLKLRLSMAMNSHEKKPSKPETT